MQTHPTKILVASLAAFFWAQNAHAKTPEQRGFEVYQHVCSTCHSMDHVRFQDLHSLGISVDDIKAYAASKQIPDGLDDDGEPKTRPGKPNDVIGSPYPSPSMGRMANHGILPPDFSRIALTHPGGAAWIEHMLQSFTTSPDKNIHVPLGAYQNTATKLGYIMMPPPLHENGVHYTDGTKATVPQMAQDVAAFLDATAHPHQTSRKNIGWGILVYLAIMTLLTAVLKRRVWR
ncbi:ubiquinol-cytochrome c reductase cytochrome c1 [Neokomagataea thailandica NBRC 106555]|uniref:Cytochrome c1 n=2 Tax=Neokomagataea TaxID=1223423 RepID=A0A4Y6VAH0_9PROT|nr:MULTISPECIES: cytochrome c1 [Neokomagataea]QDH25516.1 ubiquinol-cytochrome C reductase [Neokomagataea tanensis]GBR55047.1 ubiquinol-cytochrome c reductase cytochrome c1 [Neokomagataea thailandica NBRC 106555]